MAAIRHAGGALLRRVPAAASLSRAAVAGEQPALRSMQQYPRGLRRSASARAAFSTASTQVDISSSEPNGCSKESEEDKKKRRRMAAMMLMKSHCTDDPESEMRSINELFALLDPVTDYSSSELTELQERRSLFEKKKNALLIALLSGDAEQEKEKMAELAAAGRLLRDAVSGKYQLHGQHRDVPIKFEEDVADIKRNLMKMMEGQGKSVLEESGVADSRVILERVLADNRIMLEMMHVLKGSVADNKAMLESFGKKQNELKESFDDLYGSVDRLDDSVKEGMEEMKESIESVDESVKEVKESMSSVEEYVKDMKDSMENVEESVKDVKETMENVEESVNDMKETIDGIEEMKESIESVDESVKEIKESMGSLEESVKDVKESVENVEESVNDMKETIDGIEEMKESIESVDESVKEVKEFMGSLEESVKDVKESIESVEESVNDMKDTIENVEKSVDTLEGTVSDSLDQRA